MASCLRGVPRLEPLSDFFYPVLALAVRRLPGPVYHHREDAQSARFRNRLPMIRDALFKTVVTVSAALVLLGALGFFFESELEAFAQWVAVRIGFSGLAAILLVTDTFIPPFPNDVLLLVIAKSDLQAGWPIYVGILGVVSTCAGVQGWALGKWLGRNSVIRAALGAFTVEHENRIRKYGFWAVLAGSLTPFPFSVTCWGAGVLGLGFRPVLIASLFRIPRFYLYYWVIVAGVSFFVRV